MASLQVHSVKAYTCQVFVPLAARIASHTDTAQKHTILDDNQASLSERELGVAQLADAAPLAMQPLSMGPGIHG
jgi:hypothetical protein